MLLNRRRNRRLNEMRTVSRRLNRCCVSQSENLEDRALLAAGTFENGQFSFCVSVRFDATEAQLTQIRTAFQNASQILADATDGQHRFGTITIINDSGGTQAAEYFVHPGNGRANATQGKYGVRGEHVNLYFNSNFTAQNGADGDAYTIAHEHAHHAYGILDQYSGPNDDGSRADNDPLKAENAPFPNTPSMSFSLMDNYFTRGGRASGGGYTMNEFSVASNHDPDNDTWQSVINKRSDWEQVAASRFPAVMPAGLPVDAPPAAHTVTFQTASGGLQTMMVLDSSGSMSTENRLEFAQSGAKLFTFALDQGDSVGVASFASSAFVDFPLTEITDGSVRAGANAAIDSLFASGSTNIGGGLEAALGQIIASVNQGCNDVVVLLSDGDHNTGTDPLSVIPDLKRHGITVFTVGVGTGLSSSGEATLQQIASETGGRYKRVSGSFSLVGLMYLIAQESIGNGLLTQSPMPLTPNSTQEVPVNVEVGATGANFSLAIEDSANIVTVTLRSPSGRIITAADAGVAPDVRFNSGDNNRTFEIDTPEAGTWTVVVTTGAVASGNAEVMAFSENDGTQINVSVANGQLTFPQPVIVTATPQYQGRNVIDASVNGEVQRPDGSTTPITLFDDGNYELHGDVHAGDGVYTTKFSDYAGGGEGTYSFVVTATVTNGFVAPGDALFSFIPEVPQAVPAFTRTGSTAAIVTGVISHNSITGQKWHDLNGDGQQGADEPGLDGWVINALDSAGNVIGTALTSSIDLDGNGSIDPWTESGIYSLVVPAGEYTIVEVAQPGWIQTSPASPISVLASDLDAAHDFRTTGNDFRNWTGLDERWIYSDSGWHYITPAGGLFRWWSGQGANVNSSLVAKLSPEYHADLDLLASAPAPFEHVVTVTSGGIVPGINFGNRGASTIGGQKWEDVNRDGDRDSGERALNGWAIELVDAMSGNVIAATTTQSVDLDLDGWIDPVTEVGVYLFEGVIPGTYDVREVMSSGWAASTPSTDLLQLAADLDAALDFGDSTATFPNWGGLNENWIHGADGWYFITPDGQLWEWNNSPRTALTGTPVETLSPWFYAQTHRLTSPMDPAANLIDISATTEISDQDFGNYRTNGTAGLLVSGNSAPGLVPGNVTVTQGKSELTIKGDRYDNQVAVFVNWEGNLTVVGLQGTKVNGHSEPLILLTGSDYLPGRLKADMGDGRDLVVLQGFTLSGDARVEGGHGADAFVAIDMNFGRNLDILGGWGAIDVSLTDTTIANNLNVNGSEAVDTVSLNQVTVSNFTDVNLGAKSDVMLVRNSDFHDDGRIRLGGGDDRLAASGHAHFRRLLSVDGNAGKDSWNAASFTSGRRSTSSMESFVLASLDQVIDDVLATFAVYGLDESLIR
jgi:hypothetical protein